MNWCNQWEMLKTLSDKRKSFRKWMNAAKNLQVNQLVYIPILYLKIAVICNFTMKFVIFVIFF